MNFLRDFRLAARVLARSPGFALAALAVLTLGIGANTAIFSVVDSVLLRPLPYRDPARLVAIFESEKDHPAMNVSGPNFRDWRTQASAFSGMAAWTNSAADLIGGAEPDRVMAAVVSKDFFPMMGAHPLVGRLFRPDEERRNAPLVAVIGENLWRRSFNADANVPGRVVRLDGTNFTVVGVLPSRFDFPRLADVWVSAEPWWDDNEGRDAHNFHVLARLREDTALPHARVQMTTIAARIAQAYPSTNRGVTARVLPLQTAAAAKIAPTLQLLLVAVSFVLLIACANVANLLLCRAAGRQREMSIRAALGAGAWQLIRQLLAESLSLSLLAGLLSMALVVWTRGMLNTLVPPRMLPVDSIAIDWRVLSFALAVSFAVGVLFGLVPAVHGLRADVHEALKAAGSRTVGSASSGRFRSALIAAEVAISLVLMAGAGLAFRSLTALRGVDAGFDPRNLTIVEMALSPGDHLQHPVALYRQILERVGAMRGVADAALISSPPLGEMNPNGGFEIADRPIADRRKVPWATYTTVSEDYFAAMKIPIRRGRAFAPSDERNPNVAVVSEGMARRLWPAGDALGHRIRFFGFEQNPQWLRIVGIAGDVRQDNLADQPDDQVYVPYFQNLRYGAGYLSLVVRTRGPAPWIDGDIRRRIRAMDGKSVLRFTSMDAYVARNIAAPRLRALLLSGFAAFALILAGVGLYGVISYAAANRVREAGVRLALGAQRNDIVALFVRGSLPMIAAGLATGTGAALVLSRLARSFLFAVSPADPATFVLSALFLGSVALAAALIPALRASRTDPLTALREE
jgi:putative ABC transport system permease protein